MSIDQHVSAVPGNGCGSPARALLAVLALLACSMVSPVLGQGLEWATRYTVGEHELMARPGAGDVVRGKRSTAIDSMGNTYITGSVYISTWRVLTVKLDAAGNQLWARIYGPDDSQATALAVDGDGNVYVSGKTYSGYYPEYDFLTLKYDTDGNLAWAVRHNGTYDHTDAAAAVAVDPSGNVVVAGSSWETAGYRNIVTIKYDSSGAELWKASYDGPAHNLDDVFALRVDGAGNVYVAGEAWTAAGSTDIVTIKYNSSGTQLWVTTHDGTGNNSDRAHDLTVDASGNVYVTGYEYGATGFWNYSTVKYNSAGVEQWVATHDGSGHGDDHAYAIAVDAGGNVVVTGAAHQASGGWDCVTIKHSPSGVKLWDATYNGTGNGDDFAFALGVDGTGNSFVTGTSTGASGARNFVTIRYDANGNAQWTGTLDGAGSGLDDAYALAFDPSGGPTVAGRVTSAVGADQFGAVSYDAAGNEHWSLPGVPTGTYEQALDAVRDAAGNLYVTGVVTLPFGSDILTLKLDPDGSVVWTSTFNGAGNGNDHVSAIALDGAGGVLLLASAVGAGGTRDIVTIKYDSAGVEQWAVSFNGSGNGSDWGTDLVVDALGNVYVTGSQAAAGGGYDWVTIKYDGAGVQQWTASHSGPGSQVDTTSKVALDPTGNVVVLGTEAGAFGGYNYALAKYSPTGVEQWLVTYNGVGNSSDFANALAVDSAGSIIVTGESYASGDFDIVTVKYDTAGVQQWLATYDGIAGLNDSPQQVAVDASGTVYVAGGSRSSSSFSDWVTLKYSPSGSQLWAARAEGSEGYNAPSGLVVDAAGAVLVTGDFAGQSGNLDIRAIAYSRSGSVLWSATYDGVGGDEEAWARPFWSDGLLDLAGYSVGKDGTPDFLALRFRAPEYLFLSDFETSGLSEWSAVSVP